MPEQLNVEAEIARLAEVVDEEVTAARQATGGPGPVVDPGAEAMGRAGELAARALRESYAEAAKRMIEIGRVAREEGIRKDEECQQEAKKLMDYAEARAAEFLELFIRNKNASVTLSQAIGILAVPEKLNS